MIRNALRSIRILGPYGLILFSGLAIIVVVLVSTSDFSLTIEELVDRGDEQNEYRIVTGILLDMQWYERAYLLFGDEETYQAGFTDVNASLDDYTSDLQMWAALDWTVDAIRTNQEFLLSNFERIVTEGDALSQHDLADIFADELFINRDMHNLVLEAASEFDWQAANADSARTKAITVALIGLICFPLLALWGVLLASRVTRPLLDLTNAAACIGGRHYRSEMLSDILKKRSGIGEVARSFDAMNSGIDARKARLQDEVETLRAELYDTRRSKLELIDSPEKPQEGRL